MSLKEVDKDHVKIKSKTKGKDRGGTRKI